MLLAIPESSNKSLSGYLCLSSAIMNAFCRSFALPQELRHKYPLKDLLELSGIARSTYYYYLKQKDKDKYESEKQNILEIYNTHKGRYGYRRICSELKTKGHTINHKTVLKLMKALNLRGKQSKNGKYHSYKGEVGKVADNLLKRDFHADKPFEKLTTDASLQEKHTRRCSSADSGWDNNVGRQNSSTPWPCHNRPHRPRHKPYIRMWG